MEGRRTLRRVYECATIDAAMALKLRESFTSAGGSAAKVKLAGHSADVVGCVAFEHVVATEMVAMSPLP